MNGAYLNSLEMHRVFSGIPWQQAPHAYCCSYSWLRERDAVRQTLHRRPCLMHLNSKRPSIPQIPLNTLSTPTFSLFMPTFSDSSEAIEMEGWRRERWRTMKANDGSDKCTGGEAGVRQWADLVGHWRPVWDDSFWVNRGDMKEQDE